MTRYGTGPETLERLRARVESILHRHRADRSFQATMEAEAVRTGRTLDPDVMTRADVRFWLDTMRRFLNGLEASHG